jgi:hypothetical protein
MTTKEYHREWAQNNREKRNALNKAWKDKRQAEYLEFKKTLKCTRCGFSHPAALQFHHTDPTTKEATIATVARSWSLKKLKEEIDKCEILCANCHAIEHYSK